MNAEARMKQCRSDTREEYVRSLLSPGRCFISASAFIPWLFLRLFYFTVTPVAALSAACAGECRSAS